MTTYQQRLASLMTLLMENNAYHWDSGIGGSTTPRTVRVVRVDEDLRVRVQDLHAQTYWDDVDPLKLRRIP